MINSNALEIKDLDFDNIKESFKNFLKNQNEFKDYNFEGSNINSLLDILSYNTYYNSFYMNMIVNESFIDSASQRSSVVSLSKPVGFIPKSCKSAKIPVNILIESNINDLNNSLIIPKFSKFVSGSFYFNNIEPIILTKNNDNQFVNSDVIILFEGEYQLFRFIVKDSSDNFIIPFKNIDLDTLEVQVFLNLSNYEQFNLIDDYNRYYYKVDNLFQITQYSQVYFIQENVDGFYSINFGDNTLGKQLSIGNVIEIKFLKSSGKLGNNLKNFLFKETFNGNTNIGNYAINKIQVITIDNEIESFDGDDIQDIESIRKYTPYHFESQNRIVTIKDYEYFITNLQSNIEVLKVWGGETNIPPKYGSVFCMIKPEDKENLNSFQKKFLIDKIKSYSIIGIDFIIKDANVLYIMLKLSIKINYNNIKNVSSFKGIVDNYLMEFIKNFSNTIFRKSDLVLFLRNKTPFIKSLDIILDIKKNVNYILNSAANQTIDFNCEIIPGTVVSSTNFSIQENIKNVYSLEYFYDDKNGNLIYSYKNNLKNIELTKKFGTIDYKKGKIIIDTLIVLYFLNDSFISFTASPVENDIFTNQNSLFSLNLNQIDRIFLNDNF